MVVACGRPARRGWGKDDRLKENRSTKARGDKIKMTAGLKCPRCGGEITRGEPKCTHCGVFLKWKHPRSAGEADGERKEEAAPPGAMTVRLPAPPIPEPPQNAGAGTGAKFCSQCGAKLEAGQRFCPACGAPSDGGAASRRGIRLPSTDASGVPEGMRPLLPSEKTPDGFLSAWGRGWSFRVSGRATRKEFWLRVLGALVEVAVMFAVVAAVYQGTLESHGYYDALRASLNVAALFALVVFFPWMALRIRRCHDCGVHGIVGVVISLLAVPYQLTAWGVPFCELGLAVALFVFGFILDLVFALIPGQGGPNRWGPDPRGRFTTKAHSPF